MPITRRVFAMTAIAAAGSQIVKAPIARAAEDPAAALAQLTTHVQSTGPNGEAPSPASDLSLTPDELKQIAGMKAKAAIVMHYSGNDWSQAQIAGLKDQFGKMQIEVIAVTDAGFKSEQQVADIETVMSRNPNIIVSIPTDPTATADAYRRAAKAGVKLVFMDNVPHGMKPGQDYVSVVSADNRGNGMTAGLLMVQALNQKGNIGLVFHAADFFVTRQRYDGVKAVIAQYPGVKIIAEQGIAGPDFSGDGEKAANAMLTSHPNLNGIWAVWDVPCEGVIAAARTAGNDSLVITTCDLGANVAIAMAQGDYVKGLGAQRPFDQGTTEAKLAGYGLLGKQAPAYVALPALAVTKANLMQAWQQVYHAEPPKTVQQAMK